MPDPPCPSFSTAYRILRYWSAETAGIGWVTIRRSAFSGVFVLERIIVTQTGQAGTLFGDPRFASASCRKFHTIGPGRNKKNPISRKQHGDIGVPKPRWDSGVRQTLKRAGRACNADPQDKKDPGLDSPASGRVRDVAPISRGGRKSAAH